MANHRRDEQLTLFDVPTDLKPLAPKAFEPEVQIFSCFESSVVALSLMKGIGHNTVKALADAFEGDLSEIWKADPSRLAEIFGRAHTPSAVALVKTLESSKDEMREAGKQALDAM